MSKKPSSLYEFYQQNPQKFKWRKVYSTVSIIFWLIVIIVPFFIYPIISVIALLIFLFFLLRRPKRYLYNLSNNHRITGEMEACFPNYIMHKEEIISSFINRRFDRLMQLLEEPENQEYADHDFPIYSDDIDALDENERSYFDNIYLEIDEEEKSQKYYCLLWQVKEYANEDEEMVIGLTDVMILENYDYQTLQSLISPKETKKKKTSSLVS